MTQPNIPNPIVQDFFKTNYLLQYYNNVETKYITSSGSLVISRIYYIGVILTPTQELNISQNLKNIVPPPDEIVLNGTLLRIVENDVNGVKSKNYRVLKFIKGNVTRERANILTRDYILTDSFSVSGIDIEPLMYINTQIPYLMPESAVIDTSPENLVCQKSCIQSNSLEFLRLQVRYLDYGPDSDVLGPQPSSTIEFRPLGSELTTFSGLGLYNIVTTPLSFINLGLSLSVIEFVKCL
jgi:hypothetical protein